jgi:hypothetical protein
MAIFAYKNAAASGRFSLLNLVLSADVPNTLIRYPFVAVLACLGTGALEMEAICKYLS